MTSDGRKKFYISGPMTNDPHYELKFIKAEKELRAIGYAVVNPVNLTELLPEDETVNPEYLAVDKVLIEIVCDGIYMLDGWENSNGARLEYGWAKEANKEILFQSDLKGEG